MLEHHPDRACADLRRVAICQPSSLLKLMVSDKPGAVQISKPQMSGRARGRAARAAARGGGSGQLSLDLAGLVIKEADRAELVAGVQTTRAIVAEYA